jgi:hypothetical protein
LLDADCVKAPVHQTVGDVLRRGIGWEMSNYCFDWFLELGEEGVIREVAVGKVGLDGFKVIYAFCNDSGSVPGATELKVVLGHILELPLQLN